MLLYKNVFQNCDWLQHIWTNMHLCQAYAFRFPEVMRNEIDKLFHSLCSWSILMLGYIFIYAEHSVFLLIYMSEPWFGLLDQNWKRIGTEVCQLFECHSSWTNRSLELWSFNRFWSWKEKSRIPLWFSINEHSNRVQ